MLQVITEDHHTDEAGNPTGGSTSGIGIEIDWQDGPLGRHAPGCEPGKPCVDGCTRVEENGAFVEGVIAAAIGRLEFYQASRFNCWENQKAIDSLKAALAALESRTKSRENRAVEGTHNE